MSSMECAVWAQSNSCDSTFMLPVRPDYQTHYFEVEGFCETYDAANFVQNEWMDWSHKAETKLKELSDQILQIRVPSKIMVGLIHKVGQLPIKPGVPRSEGITNDGFVGGLIKYTQRHIHREWQSWADQMQDLCESIVREIEQARLGWVDTPVEEVLEGLDFNGLSVSKPILQQRDLKTVFRDMMETWLKKAPDTWMDPQRQVKVLLNMLFDAKSEADRMTDAEAEQIIDYMENLGLEQREEG